MIKSGAELQIKRKSGGALRTALGIALVLLPLLWLIGGPELPLPLSFGAYFMRLIWAAIFFWGIRMFARGLGTRSLLQKLQRLQGLFDSAHRVPLALAADTLGCSLSALVGDVRTMQKRKMIQGLYADLIRKDLVYVGGDVVVDPPSIPEENSIALREERKKSALPLYMLGLTWVVYAAFLPLYRSIDFVLAAIISLIVYFVSSWTTPERVIIAEQKPEIDPPASTGNQALDEMLRGVTTHLSNLRRLDKAIDGKLDEPVRDILKTTEQIVEQMRKNPASAGEMRQFFNYTLPTTITLLQNYDELSRQPVQGQNIVAAMGKIEGMMDSIVDAFHRQLDALFRDKALNIDVELKVMQNMLGHAGDITETFGDQHK